jgi:para-aminobenzoate synthetase/4-amino-4-deoxychorismate lyase
LKAICYNPYWDKWLEFKNPLQILTAKNLKDVPETIHIAEDSVEKRHIYAIGFVSYEAGCAFDNAASNKTLTNFPYCSFALFENYNEISAPAFNKNYKPDYLFTEDWSISIDKDEYYKRIEEIKHLIAEGETYQVNFTLRLRNRFSGSPEKLFNNLALSQQAEYPFFIEDDNFAICSASPELFFSLKGNKLISKPMKGTAARQPEYFSDITAKELLKKSEKNKAENTMIVDMIRNDMGRIANFNSVKVTDKFCCEQYPTVWQMTSTVESNTTASVSEIFSALFPCASITGAPKINTMKIINKLESTPRKVYTGSIGIIMPNRQAFFNVAIRTAIINKKENTIEYGTGGGIVWDSTPEGEFEEATLKAKVLSQAPWSEFEILETILWKPQNGFFLLERHLQRAENSAKYFKYRYHKDKIVAELNKLEERLQHESGKNFKIRLLIKGNGTFTIESSQLDSMPAKTAVIKLAEKPVENQNIFLYHKTTNRDIYNNLKSGFADIDDVILYNENKEITESTIANIVLKINDKLYTPKISSGLLAGTYRQHLIDSGKIKEKILYIDDLKKADEIFLINSVRKWRKAVFRP